MDSLITTKSLLIHQWLFTAPDVAPLTNKGCLRAETMIEPYRTEEIRKLSIWERNH